MEWGLSEGSGTHPAKINPSTPPNSVEFSKLIRSLKNLKTLSSNYFGCSSQWAKRPVDVSGMWTEHVHHNFVVQGTIWFEWFPPVSFKSYGKRWITVRSLLTWTSITRTPRVSPYFLYSFYLALYRTDITRERTSLSAGRKGQSISESWL